MRLSTIFISSVFMLAGTSVALTRENESMLVARSADSDFLAEVDSRAYDEEPKLYARGGAISTKDHKPLSGRYRRSEYDNDLVARGYVLSRDGSGDTFPYTSHYRRSWYEPPRYELTRRHNYTPHPPRRHYYSPHPTGPHTPPTINGPRPDTPRPNSPGGWYPPVSPGSFQ